MKALVACLSVAAGLGWSQGWAQDAADITERIRACSALEQAAKLECLDRLTHEISPTRRPTASAPPAGVPDTSSWMVSETTSPLDYTPVAVATGTTGVGPDAVMQLSIRCRAGRTELVLLSPTLNGPPADYMVTYRVNGADAVPLPIGAPSAGKGLAVKGDVVRLLRSLPDRGEISFQIGDRRNQSLQGKYGLADLSGVLARLAAPCRWPGAARR